MIGYNNQAINNQAVKLRYSIRAVVGSTFE